MKKFLYLFFLLVAFTSASQLKSQVECNADFNFEVDGFTVAFDDISEAFPGPILDWIWDFGDGTTSDAENPTHEYAEPGDYEVCLTIHADGACYDLKCRGVSIEGGADCVATFEFFGDCLEKHFYNTSDGDILSQTWSFGDGTYSDDPYPYHTYSEGGIYEVCLEIETASGCTDIICWEVEVVDCGGDCFATFEFGGDCLEQHFYNTSDGDIVSQTWSFGDGTFSDDTNPVHVYAESGTYEVCLEIETASGCTDIICWEVAVVDCEGDCTAEFEIFGTDELSIHFFGWVEPTFEEVTYTWYWGDGTSTTEYASSEGTDPWHEYTEPGIYNVCLVIETGSGCVDEFCDEIEVSGGDCIAEFEFDADGLFVEFFNVSDASSDIISYAWSFGDGSESEIENPDHTYDEPGGYTVCLTITTADGCTDEICWEIEVGEGGDCASDFEFSVDGFVVHFYETAFSGGSDITHFYWEFGDGDVVDEPNPVHEYTEAGWYEACLTIVTASGCIHTFCDSIYISEGGGSDCFAEFTFDIDGDLVNFFSETDPGPGDVISYFWSFGDGEFSDAENPEHVYDEAGAYEVCLTVIFYDGCTATFCDELIIEDGGGGDTDCEAYFNLVSIEPDGTGWFVTFNNESIVTGSDIGYVIWSFGDGTFADSYDAEHYYESPGEYTICVTIVSADGFCTDEYCETITIGEGSGECEANFDWEADGLTVTFENDADAGGSIILSYIWSFDDGTFSFDANPIHVYTESGEYEVCLSIITLDSCFDTHCESISIEDETAGCEAYFVTSSIEETPDGWAVHFNNESTGPSDNFTWYYGDGAVSETFDGEHIYSEPGIYTVCIVMGELGTDCFDEYCADIFIGSEDDCVDESVIDTTIECTEEYLPVCGCDGVTYYNECDAFYQNGIQFWTSGACVTDGIEDEKILSALNFYPNPANQFIHIEFDSPINVFAEMTIQNMYGIQVMQIYSGVISKTSSIFEIDVQSLPSGMYFILASIDQKNTITQKLLITR